MSYFIEAEAKLRKDSDPNLYSNIFDKTIAPSTAETLIFFCRQSDDFAKTVVDGGRFKDCIAKVSKEMNRQACSDFAVYEKAADFYMPGAKVEYSVKIVPPNESSNVIQLDLLSLLN